MNTDASHSNMPPFKGGGQAECAQAKTLMLRAADDEVPTRLRGWVERHVESCSACHAKQARFRTIDRDVCDYGDLLWRQNPLPPDSGTSLLAGVVAARRGARNGIPLSIPIAVAALAASVLLCIFLFRTPSPGGHTNMRVDPPA